MAKRLQSHASCISYGNKRMSNSSNARDNKVPLAAIDAATAGKGNICIQLHWCLRQQQHAQQHLAFANGTTDDPPS